MTKRRWLGFAALPLVALPLTAASVPQRYDLEVRLLQGGKLIASPRLLAAAGETATMQVENADHLGWTIKLTPTPQATPTRALVALDVNYYPVAGSRQRATTNILVDEDKPVAFEAASPFGPMRVEVKLHRSD